MNTIIMTITDLTCRHAVSPFIRVESLSTFLSLSLSLSLFLCRLLCFSGGDLTDSRGGTCLVTSLVENAVTSRGMILVKDEQSHGYCEHMFTDTVELLI